MRLGIVSDEILPDFPLAVRHGKSWGIWDYEIRTLRTGRVPRVDDDEIRSVRRTVEREGVRIAALSPGVFKISLEDPERVRLEKEEILPETFRLAELLDTRLIIVFGFSHYPNEPAENRQAVIDHFGDVARMAERTGFVVAVENEPDHWCDTGEHTAAILAEVNSPFLRANWDLGNAFCSGEKPFPDGWQHIKDYVVNVHVKDYRRKNGECECVPFGDGEIDYLGQFRALASENRPLHHVTLETHVQPFLQMSRLCAHRMQQVLRGLR
ncbi:MAG: sugar phosphate isomerase/epimerase [Calditrichaeota bacterium]|nr:sugar phosphate isomerase/epimerase [Calditrichota bacterium]